MLKRCINAKIALVLSAVVFLFAACESTPKAVASKGNELAAWVGEWVSLSTVSEEASLNEAYADAAKKMPNYTAGGVKAVFDAMRATPVLRAKFDGSNTVTFTVMSKGKPAELKCEYAYKGKVPMVGYEGYYWETFEAVKPVRGLEKAKYFIACVPESHNGGMLHWHARFGGESIDALVNGDSLWWPTYAQASMAKEELLENVKGSVGYVVSMAPESPFEAYAMHKKWINSSLIYDNDSAEVTAVYEKLIKEFAGKNPKGGDFTKEDIIAEMKKVYGNAEDFSHIEFITGNNKNELIVYSNGKEVFRSAYKRTASTDAKPGLFTVEAAKKGKFTLIAFTGAHGDPLHMHLWYGATESEFDNIKVKPTCIPADTPNARVAARVEKSCRKILTSLIENK